MLSEWFLLKFKIAQLVALALKKLRHLINTIWILLLGIYLFIASISLWRLILLVLKRLGSITKNWLKENKVDEWLKAILHGAYLGVFEGLYVFLYFLHFFRAFLTIIDYFSAQDNKNIVEFTKFLYAVFKVFISLLMLAFLIVMLANGIAPLGLLLYHTIKIFFLIYSLSKLAISFFALGFSFIHYKKANSALDHVWLKKQYENNLKKHREILMVAIPITLILTLISLGIVTGTLLWIMVAIASIFLLIDVVKAIYYYLKGSGVPEPAVAQLSQENALIDDANHNYYYRKCRTARLQNNDPEGNRIYLLKETIIKILQLKIKLEVSPSSRFNFFSEKPKILEKIKGLKQLARALLEDENENNILLDKVLKALQIDADKNNNSLISAETIKNLINELKDNPEVTIIDKNSYVRDKLGKKEIIFSQLFKQSFFKKTGACEDILNAYLAYKKMLENQTSTAEALRPTMASG